MLLRIMSIKLQGKGAEEDVGFLQLLKEQQITWPVADKYFDSEQFSVKQLVTDKIYLLLFSISAGKLLI